MATKLTEFQPEIFDTAVAVCVNVRIATVDVIANRDGETSTCLILIGVEGRISFRNDVNAPQYTSVPRLMVEYHRQPAKQARVDLGAEIKECPAGRRRATPPIDRRPQASDRVIDGAQLHNSRILVAMQYRTYVVHEVGGSSLEAPCSPRSTAKGTTYPSGDEGGTERPFISPSGAFDHKNGRQRKSMAVRSNSHRPPASPRGAPERGSKMPERTAAVRSRRLDINAMQTMRGDLGESAGNSFSREAPSNFTGGELDLDSVLTREGESNPRKGWPASKAWRIHRPEEVEGAFSFSERKSHCLVFPEAADGGSARGLHPFSRCRAGLLLLCESMVTSTDLIIRSKRVLWPASFLRFARLSSETSTEKEPIGVLKRPDVFACARETLMLGKDGHGLCSWGTNDEETLIVVIYTVPVGTESVEACTEPSRSTLKMVRFDNGLVPSSFLFSLAFAKHALRPSLDQSPTLENASRRVLFPLLTGFRASLDDTFPPYTDSRLSSSGGGLPPKTEGRTSEVFTVNFWETAPEWDVCRSRSQGNFLASKKHIVAGGSFALAQLIWQSVELTAERTVDAGLAKDTRDKARVKEIPTRQLAVKIAIRPTDINAAIKTILSYGNITNLDLISDDSDHGISHPLVVNKNDMVASSTSTENSVLDLETGILLTTM
ncbi:hypothetical protein HD554DRAFT_2036234 [Boletus coccyginus]|nr:hypothetical protein HD554DRAFT_2036234 [Boletus coccyginus]